MRAAISLVVYLMRTALMCAALMCAALICAALLFAAAGCTSASDAQSSPSPPPSALPENPSTSAVPTVLAPTSTIAVSDAVPSLDELRSMGLNDAAAECFIDTIDPNGTGRVANAELFMEAFAACL